MKLEQQITILNSLAEPSLRNAKVLTWIQENSPEYLADFFSNILSESIKNPDRMRSYILSLIMTHRTWLNELSQLQQMELHKYFTTQGKFLAAALFMPEKLDLTEETIPSSAAAKLKSLTLGERRQFSRSHHQKKLEILLYDQDPNVIGMLLNNPRVTENHVLKICRRSSISPRLLLQILEHPKWLLRPSVQQALIIHESTPNAPFVLLCCISAKQNLEFQYERVQSEERKLWLKEKMLRLWIGV